MKNIKFKYTVLLLVVVILGVIFYWYSYRPSKIKQDCSWVKVTEKAIPAQPAIINEEAKESVVKYDECVKRNRGKVNLDGALDSYVKTGAWNELNKTVTIDKCKQLIKIEHPAIPSVPEKEWYREAEREEYSFCLHKSGL